MKYIDAGTQRGWITDGRELALLDAREDGEFGASHLFWAIPCGLARKEIRARALLPRLSTRICCVDDGRGIAQDLATWAGLPLGQARTGLTSLGADLHRRDDGLLELTSTVATSEPPPARLLGGFDPLLHGWRDRSAVLAGYPGVVTTNGIFRPTVLHRGVVVGTWTLPGGVVTLDLAEPAGPDLARALTEEAAAVARFLGLPERLPVGLSR